MNMVKADAQMRNLVNQVVNGLAESCFHENSDKITEAWFCEQIFHVVDMNLLTLDEINESFGWNDVERVQSLYNRHSSIAEKNWWLLWSKDKYIQHVLKMAFAISFKYRLNFRLEFSVPGISQDDVSDVLKWLCLHN